MREHRKLSQESQHRRLLLQRIADRKQGQRVSLESDSDQSDSDASTSSPHSDFPPSTAVSVVNQHPQNTFKRLSQVRPHQQHSQSENVRRENLPAMTLSLNQQTPLPTADKKMAFPMTNPEDLLNSFSSLSVSKPARPSVTVDNSFAVAVDTQLPDEQPPGSSNEHEVAKVLSANTLPNAAVSCTEAVTEFQMKPDVEKRLYKHQLEGVKWLWSLHKLRRGGILGTYCSLQYIQLCCV